MTTITLRPSGKTVEVEPGTVLLKAVIDAGEQLLDKCTGKAECGSCHIFVTEGRKGINRIGPAENAKLDTLVGIGAKSRLACQVVVGTEPLTVELLGAMSG
ncbi:2Fe-2S iron-sulfur cluster-binding protein [Ideonella sp. A 288]|uniref:2Fe-2S iron-sulfur cluster-binding protein n=1 Tax=Ideonella sp. A 288 TaxID=1962181 RepID=UPI000B4BD88B|nr:2Fe-2S iron-sulfur cluster-binding protein [Ideonella sp. A 288]